MRTRVRAQRMRVRLVRRIQHARSGFYAKASICCRVAAHAQQERGASALVSFTTIAYTPSGRVTRARAQTVRR